MPAFAKAIIFYLVIPTNATTGARIVLDGTNGFVLVYDLNNVLVGSIAGRNGTDSLGNTVYQGITSYSVTNPGVYTQLNGGQINLVLPSPATNAATLFVAQNSGPNSDQPILSISSPANNGIPTPIRAWMDFYGGNVAQTEDPFFRFRQAGFQRDVNVLVSGNVLYADSTNANAGPEVWHAVTFAAGWSNNGGGFGNVEYRRNAIGDVELTGLASFSGTTGAPSLIFTLPVGYRPNRTVNISAETSPSPTVNPTTCTVQIKSTGDVLVSNFSGTVNPGPLSLENMKFALNT